MGRITSVIFAALEQSFSAEQYPELQLWKQDTRFRYIYRKVHSISLANATKTGDLNVYVLDLKEWVAFSTGEIIGLYLPSLQNGRLALQFLQGSEENAFQSYSSDHFEASNSVFNLAQSSLPIMQDSDIPLMNIESGESKH